MLNPTVKFHIFMTISHFFVCRTTLKSTTLEQQVCSTTQMHYNWQQTVSKEKNVATLYSTHYAKNCATLAVASQNNNRAVYIGSSESCKPKRFSLCLNKVERKYIQEQQPNQFQCYNQNMGFINRMARAWPIIGLVSERKNGGGPRLFEWQMLFFRVRGYCIVSTKMKAMSLCPFQFFKDILLVQFFLNIQRKIRQIILESFRNSKYPIRYLL